MSVHAVAGPQRRSLGAGFRIQPVAVHAVSGAQSVSPHVMSRAELAAVDAVGRVEPAPVDPVSRAEPAALHAVRGAQAVRGVSVDALGGAEEDLGPGAAS